MAFKDDHALETYKSMISLGTEILKALLLINGGAIVALLAYLGKASPRPELAQLAGKPLGFFVSGLVAAMLAFLGTYVTQFTLLNEYYKNVAFKGHMIWLGSTLIVCALSLALFGLGSCAAVAALSHP